MNYPQITDKKFERLVEGFKLGEVLRCMVDTTYAGGGLEAEVSQELARRAGKKPTGWTVPLEVFSRDLTVGTATAGGHTVATNLLANKFVDMLRPVSIVVSLGATDLTGLTGSIKIPRQTSAATAYWVAENGAPTESQQTFDQVSLAPKSLAAFTDISRRLMLQSAIDIEGFVRQDLRASLGQELDRAVLAGSGSGNEPTGILANGDIQTIALGANGAALNWANVIDLQTKVASSNANGINGAFVTTRQVRGKLQITEKSAGSGVFIWGDPINPALPGDGLLVGERAIATGLMPADLTKGSGTALSSMIYGNWSDLIIGMWGGGIELMADPYTFSTTGAVRIVAMVDVDFTVRHPESFRKITDIVTT